MFDDRMLRARKRMGLSQKEVAEKGVSYSSYSQYENNKSVPPLNVALRIANVLHTSIEWLCGQHDIGSIRNMADVAQNILNIFDSVSGSNEAAAWIETERTGHKNSVSLIVQSLQLKEFFEKEKRLSNVLGDSETEIDAYDAWLFRALDSLADIVIDTKEE